MAEAILHKANATLKLGLLECVRQPAIERPDARGGPAAAGGHLRRLMPQETHVRNDRFQGTAAVGRGHDRDGAPNAADPFSASQLSASSTSSFNSVLASVRSGRSNPSVNQP